MSVIHKTMFWLKRSLILFFFQDLQFYFFIFCQRIHFWFSSLDGTLTKNNTPHQKQTFLVNIKEMEEHPLFTSDSSTLLVGWKNSPNLTLYKSLRVQMILFYWSEAGCTHCYQAPFKMGFGRGPRISLWVVILVICCIQQKGKNCNFLWYICKIKKQLYNKLILKNTIHLIWKSNGFFNFSKFLSPTVNTIWTKYLMYLHWRKPFNLMQPEVKKNA